MRTITAPQRTKKNQKVTIHGTITSKKEGWINIHIYGEAFDRGFAHGALLHNELERNRAIMSFLVRTQIKTTMTKYMAVCMMQIKPVMMDKYPEFYRELEGISAGAKYKGNHKITVDFLIAWNATLSLYSYFCETTNYRCSAFIATGSHTRNGDIVMAHNTHCDFVTGQTSNIIMTVTPPTGKGSEFVMQTCAGFIASGTDWFINRKGLMGCETTLSSMKHTPVFGEPYFCRIRKVMQYADSLHDCETMMLQGNAGDYACSWLFGDTNTNEIMLLELGVKMHSTQRTHDGVFYGMNSAIDPLFRAIETTDIDHYNVEVSVGSRNHRFHHLLYEKYGGALDLDNAKLIMADHHDEWLNREQMDSRNICKHAELDEKAPKPFGCVDGKVTDSRMAKRMQFMGRFGSSCGRIFNADEFIQQNAKYKSWEKWLVSFPRRKWTILM